MTRVLIVEDNPHDAVLVERELTRSGLDYTSRRVMNEEDFVTALRDFMPDVVLSDHSLPTFGAKDAVRIARLQSPEVPVIVVTGRLEDETAVEYLKAGAADYILKHKLVRLGPAVRRALELKSARDAESSAERGRLAALEQYREASERMRAIFEASPMAMISVDVNGIVRLWNPAATRLFGWSETEAVGKPLPFIPQAEQESVRQRLERTMAGDTFAGIDLRRLRKGGGMVDVRAYLARQLDGSGKPEGVIAVYEDLGHQRQLERQLYQSQKMESIGRLAGGVAHDFNNLLTIIMGETELALSDVPADSPVADSLTQVRKAGQQAAELTRQLLAFSRRQAIEPKVFSVEEMVRDLEKMLRRLIGEDVKLECRLTGKTGDVRADPGQLNQVLVNLAVNARDAMPRGGLLTIETDRIYLDEEYAGSRADVTPGDYVVIAVSDTGIGIPPDVISQIFEPFFTTKEAGRGTGLGLATCYGIVKQAGGHIVVYSEVGVGTTMRVYLPVAEGASNAAKEGAPAPTTQGTGTILLVEDQVGVRDLTARMLRAQGYKVIAVAGSIDALRVLGESTDKFTLLLTDVVLPDLNGGTLAERARALAPNLKVLFTSGYTPDVIAFHNLAETGGALIQKPFTAATLGRKVREVMDGQAG